MKTISSSPTVKRGIVMYEKEPYYYIEQVIINNDVMVLAYNVDEESILQYRESGDYHDLDKANKRKQVLDRKIKTKNTPLAKYVSNKLGDKNITQHIVYQYQLPVFISNLDMDSDTVTGVFGVGFKEKVSSFVGKTALDAAGKFVKKYPRMVDTGVFIGNSSIKWLNSAITPQGLLSMIEDDYLVYLNDMSFSVPFPYKAETVAPDMTPLGVPKITDPNSTQDTLGNTES